MGLIEDQPDKGTIEFMGRRIDGEDTEEIVRMGISYVPEGREVFEELTVRENLLMGAYLRKDRIGVKERFRHDLPVFPGAEGQGDTSGPGPFPAGSSRC